MILLPSLSCQEWLDLLHILRDTFSKLPKTGNFEPCYDACSWDYEDLYRVFREDAVRSQSEVQPLVEGWERDGVWQRGKYNGKFWLKARIETASAFVQDLLEESSRLSTRYDASLPKDEESVMKLFLYRMWDEQFVDLWLKDNLEYFVSLHDNPGGEKQEQEFSSWLSDVHNGIYLTYKNGEQGAVANPVGAVPAQVYTQL